MTHAPEALYRQAVALFARKRAADTVCAMLLLQQAAGHGHTEAAAELAQRLSGESSKVRALSPDEAYAALVRKEQLGAAFEYQLNDYAWLAESGHAPAQLRLLAYHTEHLDPQARYWAELAAGQNLAEGHYRLAEIHRDADTPDWARVLHHYRAAAGQNHPAAHWQLGLIHFHGHAAAADSAAAEHHLRQAAEHGYTAARTLLGRLLAAQNRPEAITCYRQAASDGDNHACALLAEALLTGRLCERDPHGALRLLKAPAEQHHPEALRLLGDIYRYGLGVKSDTQAAAAYYRQAAEAGNTAAAQKLVSDAALYQPDHYDALKTAALHAQAAEQHYRRACALHHGAGGTTDRLRARKHYLAAAEHGHAEACAALGVMYERGQSVRPDMQQAAYWFGLAAEQGHAHAQYRLAMLYRHGRGVPHHPALACHWLETAIANRCPHPPKLAELLAAWQQETDAVQPAALSASDT